MNDLNRPVRSGGPDGPDRFESQLRGLLNARVDDVAGAPRPAPPFVAPVGSVAGRHRVRLLPPLLAAAAIVVIVGGGAVTAQLLSAEPQPAGPGTTFTPVAPSSGTVPATPTSRPTDVPGRSSASSRPPSTPTGASTDAGASSPGASNPGASSPAGAGGPATGTPGVSATVRTVVRPVTAAGRVAPGFVLITDQRSAITCDSSSPVAVDDGIAWCGSSADNAIACWRSATRGRVLCLTDPFTDKVLSIALSGSFPDARAADAPVPQALTLADGTDYLISVNGGGGRAAQEPDWVDYYIQRTTFVRSIYGPIGGGGLDRTKPLWTAVVFTDLSKAGVRTPVNRAYEVGTAG